MHALLGGGLLLASAAWCQPYTAWLKSGTVTLGTTAAWANFTGNVADFPLLVRLDSAVFNFSEAKAGGADIRFSSADGLTNYPYEIETWDAAKGKASAWVKIPAIAGQTIQTFKMYWNNAAAASQSSGTAVFPPANGYAGVWHLSDDSTSALNRDATGNGNDGIKYRVNDADTTRSAAAVPVVSSPMGTGQSYNLGADKAMTRVPAGKIDLRNKSMTVSAWMQRAALNAGDYYIAQGTQDANLGMRLGFDYLSRFTFTFSGGLTENTSPYTKPIDTRDWHLWVGTFDSATRHMSVYRDGALDTSSVARQAFTGSGSVDFGWAYGPSGEYYHPAGSLDQVEISTTVRSPGWIRLSYLNQNPNQRLVGFPVPAGCVESFSATPASVSVTEGAPVALRGTAKCAQMFQWVKVDSGQETPVVSNGTRLELSTRVRGTSALTYRFKGLFAGVWRSQDVTINVTEAIPEPDFTLGMPTAFDFSSGDPMLVSPAISNLGAVLASSAPNIRYQWTSSGVDHFTFKSANNDTLSVYFQNNMEGDLTVQLCLDNGGPVLCKSGVTHAQASGILPGRGLSGQKILRLRGSSLVWNEDAAVGIWAVDGRRVFFRLGRKGESMNLNAGQLKLFRKPGYFVKVFSLSHIGNRKHPNLGGMP